MIYFTNINGELLPEDVNKIANERILNIYGLYNNLTLREAFIWKLTIEHKVIWEEVYEGNYEPLRKFHNL